MGPLRKSKINKLEKEIDNLYDSKFRANDAAKKAELEAKSERAIASNIEGRIKELSEMLEALKEEG